MARDERQEREVLEAAVARGVISAEQLAKALEIAAQLKRLGLPESLSDVAVKKGFLSAQERDAIARELEHDASAFPFEIQEEIGSGAVGTVYRARQRSLDRLVALKILKPQFARDPRYVKQFIKEARASAKFNHVNIVQGIDAGPYKDSYYFAMELVDGRSLGELIRKRKRLRIEEAISIVLQVARALDYAAKLGLVHRDIKPDNILVDKSGAAKLCDLGMARLSVSEDLIKAGVAVGTPYYMSPEQARGQTEIDIRADLYALGATMYHMLTGEPPFRGKSVDEVLRRQLTDTVPDPRLKNPALSSDLALVLAKLMAKDRRQRYHTPLELQRDLELVSSGRPPRYAADFHGDSTLALRIGARMAAKRYLPYTVAAAALLLVLTAALTAALLVTRSPSVPETTGTQLPEPGARPPEVSTAPETSPPDENLALISKRYDELVAVLAAQPEERDNNIRLLEKFIQEAGETPYKELAVKRLKQIKQALAQALADAEKERLAAAENQVQALIKAGKLAEASELIQRAIPPGGDAAKLRERLFAAINQREAQLWGPYNERINNNMQAHQFEAAREVAAEAAGEPERALRDRAALALKRIADAEAAWQQEQEKQREREAEQRRQQVQQALERFIAEYAAVFTAGRLSDIQPLIDRYQSSYPELAGRLTQFATRYPGWVTEARAEAIRTLSTRRDEVAITWRDRSMKGVPVNRQGDTVFIRSAEGIELPVRAEDLALSDVLTFASLLAPKEDEPRLCAAAVCLVYGDFQRAERLAADIQGEDAETLRRLLALAERKSAEAPLQNLLERADKAFAAGKFAAAEGLYGEFAGKAAEQPSEKRAYAIERQLRSVALGGDPFMGIFDGEVSVLASNHFVVVQDFTRRPQAWAKHWFAQGSDVRPGEKCLEVSAAENGRITHRGLGYIRCIKTQGEFVAGTEKKGWAGLGLGDIRFRFWAGGGGTFWTVTDGNEWNNDAKEDLRPGKGPLERFDFEAAIEKGKMLLRNKAGETLAELDYNGPGQPAVIEVAEATLKLERVEVEGFLADWFVRLLIVRHHYREALDKHDGLRAMFFSDRLFKARVGEQVLRNLDFRYEGAPMPQVPDDGFSIRCAGFLVIPDDGEYTFYTQGTGTFRLLVGGRLALFRKPDQGEVEGKPIRLKRGLAPLAAEYVDAGGEASNRLEWRAPAFERRPVPADAFVWQQ